MSRFVLTDRPGDFRVENTTRGLVADSTVEARTLNGEQSERRDMVAKIHDLFEA